MGVCCTGKPSKTDFKNEEVIRPYRNGQDSKIINQDTSMNVIPVVNAGINYDIIDNDFNKNITSLINNTNTIMNRNQMSEILRPVQTNQIFPISKINLEHLWNIFMTYKDDFTSCNLISLDLRKNKPENFLKKMKRINYTIEEMLNMRNDKTDNFKRYLKKKIIFVIVDNDSNDNLSKIIQIFIEKQFDITSMEILNTNLNVEMMSSSEKNILKAIDLTDITDYPFILLSLKYMSHIRTDNYVFFQKVKISQIKDNTKYKFIPEHLTSNKIVKEDPFLGFCSNFRLNTILRATNGMSNDSTSDFKRAKTDGPIKKTSLVSINFSSINDRVKEITIALDKMKQEIAMDKSILLQIDDTYDDKTILIFAMLLIWRVSSLPINLIVEYLNFNVYFIPNANDLYIKDKNEINELFALFEYK